MANSNIDAVPEPSIDRTEAAYLACLEEISAVKDAEVLPVTLDVLSITTSLLGILPELRALRPQLEDKLRNFDFARFDKLEQYALALAHAHGIFNRLSAPRADVVELAAEVTRLRDLLFNVASPLVDLGLVGRSELDRCKVAVGYRPLIGDVITLVGVFKDHWGALEGKVPVTPELLLRAKNLALELMQQVGLKEQSPVAAGDAAVIRQKAFTLFVRTYEEARRTVVYLRGARGDADEIAPSFYALRSGKRRPSEEEATPVAPAANGTPKAVSAAASVSGNAAPSIVIDNVAGLPMESPFVH